VTSGGKVWPPVYYDASMTLMSKGPTQQCLRFVTTVLQQTNETVTYQKKRWVCCISWKPTQLS